MRYEKAVWGKHHEKNTWFLPQINWKKEETGEEHVDQNNRTNIKTTSNVSVLFQLKKSFMKQLEI